MNWNFCLQPLVESFKGVVGAIYLLLLLIIVIIMMIIIVIVIIIIIPSHLAHHI
jgi:hypothetical protein